VFAGVISPSDDHARDGRLNKIKSKVEGFPNRSGGVGKGHKLACMARLDSGKPSAVALITDEGEPLPQKKDSHSFLSQAWGLLKYPSCLCPSARKRFVVAVKGDDHNHLPTMVGNRVRRMGGGIESIPPL